MKRNTPRSMFVLINEQHFFTVIDLRFFGGPKFPPDHYLEVSRLMLGPTIMRPSTDGVEDEDSSYMKHL